MGDLVKRLQEIRFAPISLFLTAVGSVAALFGAAIALVKWIS